MKVMSRTLSIIRDSTGSQCSSRRAGLMCSYRLVPVIRRAAAFLEVLQCLIKYGAVRKSGPSFN